MRGERERDARQVLHHPVVEVAGDAPPLGVGGLDRLLQQVLALLLGAPQTARASDSTSGTCNSSRNSSDPSVTGAKRSHARRPASTTPS